MVAEYQTCEENCSDGRVLRRDERRKAPLLAHIRPVSRTQCFDGTSAVAPGLRHDLSDTRAGVQLPRT